MIKYTEDCGVNYHYVMLEASNFSEAYAKASMEMSPAGAITEIELV
jgi:hypothetical protein